jgi:hypothetical protein
MRNCRGTPAASGLWEVRSYLKVCFGMILFCRHIKADSEITTSVPRQLVSLVNNIIQWVYLTAVPRGLGNTASAAAVARNGKTVLWPRHSRQVTSLTAGWYFCCSFSVTGITSPICNGISTFVSYGSLNCEFVSQGLRFNCLEDVRSPLTLLVISLKSRGFLAAGVELCLPCVEPRSTELHWNRVPSKHKGQKR